MSACPTLSKDLDISSAMARAAPDLSKTRAVLSDTTVWKSAVNREDLTHTGNQKKDHISLDDQQSYHWEVFKRN